jgi:S1-C subfamily serine protease
MNKKHSIYLITIAVIVSVIFQLFLTPTLLARLSVSSWLSKFKILNPQAPIVINTVKEVRVSDTGDVQQALGKLKPGISAIFMADASGVKMTGGAINISSDGIFVSSKLALPANSSAKYFIVLSDGTTKELNKEVLDPVTNLVFLKADLSNVPVANLVNSQDLEVGQKVIFVQGSGVTFTPRAEVSYVTVSQQDNLNQIFSADKPSREFGVQGLNNRITVPDTCHSSICCSNGHAW